MTKSRLGMLCLEDRCMPSTTGVVWPDGAHLRLSFVPDGTQVGSLQSNLFSTFNAIAPTATWESEILRAFQTWASNANLNVGVVADSGAPMGTAGAVQGDPRFGDIRIAAVPLDMSTISTNTAFQWSGSTWSGDVMLNTNYLFSAAQGQVSNKYDLYTCMLNEAGNVFGVTDNRTDTASGVYYQYTTAKTGIDSNDVTDIKSLYGARSADAYDAIKSNSTTSAATVLNNTPGNTNVEADITSTSDVDYFKLTIPSTSSAITKFTVKLTTSGLSGLLSTLNVYNSSNTLVGSAAATDPLNGNLTITINSPAVNSIYYIRAASNATSVFGIGSYKLNVVYTYANGTTSDPAPSTSPTYISTETNTNDTYSKATSLTARDISNARIYVTQATIYTTSDVDYYKVVAPTNLSGTLKMNVLVWALEQTGVVPRIDVYNSSNQLVSSNVLGDAAGTYSVEIPTATAGATYYVKVSAQYPSGHRAIGNYTLGVSFNTQPATSVAPTSNGTLTPSLNQAQQTLTVNQNHLYNLVLSANAGSAAWTEVRMQILNSSGQVVYTLDAYSGMPAVTGQVYLQPGTYTVTYTATPSNGSSYTSCSFTLAATIISDPIGPQTATITPVADSWSTITTNFVPPFTWVTPYYF